MTAVLQERPLPQPQSKGLPTVQSSHPAIVATKAISTSRAQSKSRVAKPRQDGLPADFTSRPATLSLIRRILISDSSQHTFPPASPEPIEGSLPPLTSSNEIDLQLYAIIAVVVKDVVNTWYSKITQDHTFVDEIVQIIAHCSRALEQRIRHTDVAELLLDELPLLLENHVTATSSVAQQAYGVHPRVTYHSLNPHPALDPIPTASDSDATLSSTQEERSYRQLLINGALAVLLPTEDLQNAPLRILVSDIIADLILGQAVAGKICEGWFIHDAIVKAVAFSKRRVESKSSGGELRHNTKTRLEEFGLLNTERHSKHYEASGNSRLTKWFWLVLQWIYLTVMGLRFVMQGLFSARHLPKRSLPSSYSSGSQKISPATPIVDNYDQSPRPVLAYSASNFVSTLMRLPDRMPWLGGTITLGQHMLLAGSGRLAATNSLLDRFFHHVLTDYVFTPNIVVHVLLGLRSAVFPNNSLGPPAPPAPSLEQRLDIRRNAARALLSLAPSAVAHMFFNTRDEDKIVQQIERDILDVFGDSYLNKHLIYGILELVLVRLIPELQEAGVGDLLVNRGVNWDEGDMAVAVPNIEQPSEQTKEAEFSLSLSQIDTDIDT